MTRHDKGLWEEGVAGNDEQRKVCPETVSERIGMAGYDRGLEGGELRVTGKKDRKKYDNGPEGEARRDTTMDLERREYQDEWGGDGEI